jgi:cyclophilin family peptidyl-prolyl cis-trans isomerase
VLGQVRCKFVHNASQLALSSATDRGTQTLRRKAQLPHVFPQAEPALRTWCQHRSGLPLQEFDADSASSQIFFLLKESELTPSQANILDGRYAVFGYIVDNEDFLADLKVGDTIESIRVIQGLENLQNPSYKVRTRCSGLRAPQYLINVFFYCLFVTLNMMNWSRRWSFDDHLTISAGQAFLSERAPQNVGVALTQGLQNLQKPR